MLKKRGWAGRRERGSSGVEGGVRIHPPQTTPSSTFSAPPPFIHSFIHPCSRSLTQPFLHSQLICCSFGSAVDCSARRGKDRRTSAAVNRIVCAWTVYIFVCAPMCVCVCMRSLSSSGQRTLQTKQPLLPLFFFAALLRSWQVLIQKPHKTATSLVPVITKQDMQTLLYHRCKTKTCVRLTYKTLGACHAVKMRPLLNT